MKPRIDRIDIAHALENLRWGLGLRRLALAVGHGLHCRLPSGGVGAPMKIEALIDGKWHLQPGEREPIGVWGERWRRFDVWRGVITVSLLSRLLCRVPIRQVTNK